MIVVRDLVVASVVRAVNVCALTGAHTHENGDGSISNARRNILLVGSLGTVS